MADETRIDRQPGDPDRHPGDPGEIDRQPGGIDRQPGDPGRDRPPAGRDRPPTRRPGARSTASRAGSTANQATRAGSTASRAGSTATRTRRGPLMADEPHVPFPIKAAETRIDLFRYDSSGRIWLRKSASTATCQTGLNRTRSGCQNLAAVTVLRVCRYEPSLAGKITYRRPEGW